MNVEGNSPIPSGMLYLPDEHYIEVWERAENGVFPKFPSGNLADFPSIKVEVYQSFAGRIPVLHAGERKDFEGLLCAIFYKGERKPIPASMGASMIKGWKDVTGQTHRVILLSDGYYSAIPPEEMGLSPDEWKAKSFILRRTHECTHYYTLRAYGFMNQDWKDELIADAMGIIEAFGEYRSAYFLRFMGLEGYPAYRIGGRLENYYPKGRELRPDERQDVQRQVYEASLGLEHFLQENPEFLSSEEGKRQLLDQLASLDFDFR